MCVSSRIVLVPICLSPGEVSIHNRLLPLHSARLRDARVDLRVQPTDHDLRGGEGGKELCLWNKRLLLNKAIPNYIALYCCQCWTDKKSLRLLIPCSPSWTNTFCIECGASLPSTVPDFPWASCWNMCRQAHINNINIIIISSTFCLLGPVNGSRSDAEGWWTTLSEECVSSLIFFLSYRLEWRASLRM